MSCSKFSTVTPASSIHGLDIRVFREIPKIKNRFGHGFTRTTEAFCIATKNGETVETNYWLMQKFITPNKKEELKTSNVYIWRVLSDKKIESFMSSEDIFSMSDNEEMRIITCDIAIEELIDCPKSLAACLYTTNSFAALSSMSPTHDERDPSCLEFYFNVIAKSELSLRQIAPMPADAVHQYMQKTRFIDGDTLNDMVQNLGNDERFHARAADSLSNDARKMFNDELLRHTRENIDKSGDHTDFKVLVCAWIGRNLQLPKLFDPVMSKEKVGRMLPLPDVSMWNQSVGLLMIVIASKLYMDSPVDLQNALPAGYGALVAEYTPRDERYGMSVDKKMDLGETCATPQGKFALIKLIFAEHTRQEAFISDLKAILDAPGNDEQSRATAALTKLTKGIDEYGASIHGLCRAILLRVLTGDLKFPPLLYNAILNYFRDNFGLNWNLHHPQVFEDESGTLDPFQLLHMVGESSHPMREECVGVKRSLSE
jgi:hypothetical protein